MNADALKALIDAKQAAILESEKTLAELEQRRDEAMSRPLDSDQRRLAEALTRECNAIDQTLSAERSELASLQNDLNYVLTTITPSP